jgi:16S rRNA (guanine1207-N2)-methyltransferase
LWLVANLHLPYEAALAEGFGEVEEVGGDAGFKVIAAKRPVSATRGGRRKAVRKRR